MFRTSYVAAACVVAVVCLPGSASAAGLLDRLTGGGSDNSVLGVVGGRDSDALITLGQGDAGDRGLVNVGLGGDDGEVVDVEIGGRDTPLVDAEVSVGGSGGLVKVDTNVGGGLVDADVSIGNGRDVVDVDVDVGSGGDGGERPDGDGEGPGGVNGGVDNGDGDDGSGGNGGGNGGSQGGDNAGGSGGDNGDNDGSSGGGTDNNNGGGTGGNNGGSTGNNSGGSVSGRSIPVGAGGGGGVSCSGTNTGQLVSLFKNTRMQNWNRARNVQVMPIRVCAALRNQVADWLISNRSYHQMVGAVAGHRMITETLSQSNFQPGHVLAVHDAGDGKLMVYVF